MYELIFTHKKDLDARPFVWNGTGFFHKPDTKNGKTYKTEAEAQADVKTAKKWTDDHNAVGTITVEEAK